MPDWPAPLEIISFESLQNVKLAIDGREKNIQHRTGSAVANKLSVFFSTRGDGWATDCVRSTSDGARYGERDAYTDGKD